MKLTTDVTSNYVTFKNIYNGLVGSWKGVGGGVGGELEGSCRGVGESSKCEQSEGPTALVYI